MVTTINIVQNIIYLVNKNKESSYLSPAYGWSGTRATLLLFFSEATTAPALRALKQKGKKEEGLGEGIFALLLIKIERFRFSLIKRKPKGTAKNHISKNQDWKPRRKAPRQPLMISQKVKIGGGGGI